VRVGISRRRLHVRAGISLRRMHVRVGISLRRLHVRVGISHNVSGARKMDTITVALYTF
jgi:hypothetical protein